ncbi:uncharacterized protein LOC141850644 [Brevipalpus obovatus]|uniref:uncharacterized protein LOC141850644 n=1 Tax=Brevipalpus obovatus TaxID=246614 RepID=UPI003D9E90AE
MEESGIRTDSGIQEIGESRSISGMTKAKGLSVMTAAVFIAGEMAGSGILALPRATANAGWFGVALILIIAWASAKACLCLSDSWIMIEKKWPEYQNLHVRDPYPTIAGHSIGPRMKKLSSVMMDLQLFGVTLVFLLLCAELVASLIASHVSISYCSLIVVIGIILCPLTWFGSPADFPPVAFGAMISSVLSSIIVIIILAMQSGDKIPQSQHSAPSFKSFLLGLSTIAFAYGGAVTIPTFQNDMKKKEQFPSAVNLGFAMMLGLYLPISLGSYVIIGDSVVDNVLESCDSGTATDIVNVLMAFHVFCAFLIVINPLNQDLEQQIKVEHSFNLKRCAFRSILCAILIFTGLTVPKFGKILNLVGSATVIPQTFIFPPWFYYNLINITGEKKMTLSMTIQLASIAILGVITMIAATYFAITDLIEPGSFTKPCYIH